MSSTINEITEEINRLEAECQRSLPEILQAGVESGQVKASIFDAPADIQESWALRLDTDYALKRRRIRHLNAQWHKARLGVF